MTARLLNPRRLGASLLALGLAACGANETHPGNTRDPYRAGGEVPLTCVPNLDGQIAASELTPAFGVSANYLVSPAGTERFVDVAGLVDASGRRLWDWSLPVASDQVATLVASAVTGKWYAASFPADAFVAPLDAGHADEGIYRHTAAALQLLGVASTQENPASGRTLIVYSAPVDVYRFPLRPGDEWTSVGTVRDSMFRGLPYAGRDTYEVRVDAAGHLALPEFDFTQALRVRLRTTVVPSVGLTVVRRQVSFLSECFGEIARATSRVGEDAENFTTASEIRRLGQQ